MRVVKNYSGLIFTLKILYLVFLCHVHGQILCT